MKKIIQIITLSLCSITANAAIPVDLDLTLVGSVSNNVGVRHAGDGSNRLFVISQSGVIRVFDDQDNLLATPFLSIQSKIVGGSERGLLGLAFHPDYAANGFFYVNYTKASPNTGDTIIERYQVSAGDPNVADVNSGTVIMRIVQDFSNHNGGDILFGPDGYLYIPLGDGGAGNDPNNRAQSMDQLLGKILRIDVDGSLVAADNECGLDAANYGIPNDNPFANDSPGDENCDEIWASGVRNPWRSSFDRLNGDFFSGDVGQNAREEINFQPSTSPGGENYGWKCREGDVATPGVTCIDPPPFIEPILVQPTGSNCAIMGGYRYRGPITGIQGQYIYSDICSARIWFATESGGSWSDELWSETLNTSSFGEDEQGNVYLSTLGGSFYRITGTIEDLIFENGFE
ncbi:MAG: PQQ-dependent sugar dehydrogenase [Proteobacteria bacterium]|nr:PQQ-dependent sugar dehydrogenase [Pseudomonadota bacterium]